MPIDRRIVRPREGGIAKNPAGRTRTMACAALAALLAASAATAQVQPGGPPRRNNPNTPRPATAPGASQINPAGAQPPAGAEGATGHKGVEHLPAPEPGEDEVTLSAFS